MAVRSTVQCTEYTLYARRQNTKLEQQKDIRSVRDFESKSSDINSKVLKQQEKWPEPTGIGLMETVLSWTKCETSENNKNF